MRDAWLGDHARLATQDLRDDLPGFDRLRVRAAASLLDMSPVSSPGLGPTSVFSSVSSSGCSSGAQDTRPWAT
jgi:hypothetical protein